MRLRARLPWCTGWSPRRKEGFCDAPEAVLIGFGAVTRHLFMTPEAAAEPCVRSALLAHEGRHDRTLDEAIHAFILLDGTRRL